LGLSIMKILETTLAEQCAITRRDSIIISRRLNEALENAFLENEHISFPGVFTYRQKHQEERERLNPLNKTKFIQSARMVPKIRISKNFRDKLAKSKEK